MKNSVNIKIKTLAKLLNSKELLNKPVKKICVNTNLYIEIRKSLGWNKVPIFLGLNVEPLDLIEEHFVFIDLGNRPSAFIDLNKKIISFAN
jgi:hypothetical protein